MDRSLSSSFATFHRLWNFLLFLIANSFAGYATLHLGVGIPDIIGGGVSLTAFRPLEVEVGGSTGIIYNTLFARAGVALPLHDGRTGDHGLLLEGLGLGGWRWLRNVYWSGGDAKNGAELNLAVELSYWFHPHLALDLQVLGGGGLWLDAQPTGLAGFGDGRLTVGLAF